MQRYLQTSLHTLTLIASNEHIQKIVFANNNNSEEFLVGLVDLLNIESQAIKTSILFLISLLAPLNKLRVLENLFQIFKELFTQFSALLYYNNYDSNTEGEDSGNEEANIKEEKKDLPEFENIVRVGVELFAKKQADLIKKDSQFTAEGILQAVKKDLFSKQKELLVRNEMSIFQLLMQVVKSLVKTLRNLISPYLPVLSAVVLSYFSDSSDNNNNNKIVQ